MAIIESENFSLSIDLCYTAQIGVQYLVEHVRER